MSADENIRDVLRFYPQIYLAYHVDHVRAASTEWGLSAADSSILAHLDTVVPTSPRALAAHLGVAASTLSAALRRLEMLGYIANTPVADDRRRRNKDAHRSGCRGDGGDVGARLRTREGTPRCTLAQRSNGRRARPRPARARCAYLTDKGDLMKIIAIALASLLALVLIVVVVGALLPRRHEVSRSAVIAAPPAAVYAAVTDVANAAAWRPGVQRIEVLGRTNGGLRFRENSAPGAVTYEVTAEEPVRLFVTEIVDRNLGYSGSWTYSFAPQDAGTRVTITERGEVSNVIFRFVSRLVVGQTKSIDTYLAALARHVTPSAAR